MKFLAADIGELVVHELSKAIEARVAVAFFSPDDRLLSALNVVPKLTVIVSEEFTVNNPYLLERLTKAKLRSVPPDSDGGKLHAFPVSASDPAGRRSATRPAIPPARTFSAWFAEQRVGAVHVLNHCRVAARQDSGFRRRRQTRPEPQTTGRCPICQQCCRG